VIHVARRGYGFVDTPEGEYFVLRAHMHGAMDGDTVEVARLRKLEAQRRRQRRDGDGDGERELLGDVRRVVQRAHSTVIGTLHYADGLGVVVPEDERIRHDVFIDPRLMSVPARDGDIVVVRLTTYPGRHEAAQGCIEEVIGHSDECGLPIDVIIRRYGFETAFGPQALKEAADARMTEEPGRRDLRDRYVFTIDPEDAKDFDDALSLEYVDGKMRLGVHIADVSAYVPRDGAIDLEARRRATSVYLPDRVLPMLPPALSDDLCSLKPDVDRPAFTVDIYLDKNGVVDRYDIYPSLIHSRRRLTYDEVLAILECHPALDAGPSGGVRQKDEMAVGCFPDELAQKLQALDKLAKTLEQRRIGRGAIEFDGTEVRVALDDEGMPVRVYKRGKTRATSLVEEAMILANEQVAHFMLQREAPMVYRIHDEPAPAALQELLPTLQEFGYAVQGAPRSSSEIQALLDAAKGKPEFELISHLLLRAMKRARYAPAFTTHFGLASTAYTHFTSPIRRYPDLMVHRLLKTELSLRADAAQDHPVLCPSGHNPPHQGRGIENALGDRSYQNQMDWICEHCSERERDAEHATFDAIKAKLCLWLQPRVGERFEGIISSVNTYGFMVREQETGIDGAVDREQLSEGSVYEPNRYRWIDYDTGNRYRLGQTVSVTLQAVDLHRSQVGFTLG
jgi:ribonuclease R